MAIERNTYTDILFDALMAAGCTIYGACAAMGNIYAESGANPRNLENLCEKKLNYKYTDDTYTEAVDSGKITRALFLHPLGDSRQYGLRILPVDICRKKGRPLRSGQVQRSVHRRCEGADGVYAERIAEEL